MDPKNEGTITKYDQLWNPLLAPTMFKQLFVASVAEGELLETLALNTTVCRIPEGPTGYFTTLKNWK